MLIASKRATYHMEATYGIPTKRNALVARTMKGLCMMARNCVASCDCVFDLAGVSAIIGRAKCASIDERMNAVNIQ
jgi:hypothetical protein